MKAEENWVGKGVYGGCGSRLHVHLSLSKRYGRFLQIRLDRRLVKRRLQFPRGHTDSKKGVTNVLQLVIQGAD